MGQKLPSDAALVSMKAKLALSKPFRIEVVFATEDPDFSVDDALFSQASVELDQETEAPTVFDGVVHEAGFVASSGQTMLFSITICPSIEILRHRRGSRVFTDLSRVDVVKKILGEAGVGETVSYRLRETYEPRPTLMQYRESELDFIGRLLEDEGIFYTFSFDAEGHHLIVGDNPDALSTDAEPVRFGHFGTTKNATSSLGTVKRTLKLRPSSVHLRDYDVRHPAVFPEAVAPADSPIFLEHFAVRGGFETGAAAKRLASARLASLRSDADELASETSSLALRPGVPIIVEATRSEALQGDYVPVEVQLQASQPHPAFPGLGGEAKSTFRAVPKGTRFAPPRSASRPKIRGLQTARVTGPVSEPENIHVDDLGRIKVRFLWDRSGKTDDTSSAWVRVSQILMGGAMILPRVGWEVAVAFEGGNPDRPLVVGRVYSAEEMPPYALPGEAASTAIHSRSSPGGAGMNEIKLGDSKGSQGFGVNAQKDMNSGIGNNKTESVSGNETSSIGVNLAISIGADETLSVSGNQDVNVGNALQTKIKGSETIAISGSDTVKPTKDLVESVGGSRIYAIGGTSFTMSNGIREEITGASTVTVGAADVSLSAGTISDTMLATYDETVGALTAHLVAGSHVESSASKDQKVTAAALILAASWTTEAAGVTLLVGGLHLRQVGGDITISGSEVLIGGGVGTFTAGGATLKLGGGPVTLTGSGVKLEGAIVKSAGKLNLGG